MVDVVKHLDDRVLVVGSWFDLEQLRPLLLPLAKILLQLKSQRWPDLYLRYLLHWGLRLLLIVVLLLEALFVQEFCFANFELLQDWIGKARLSQTDND